MSPVEIRPTAAVQGGREKEFTIYIHKWQSKYFRHMHAAIVQINSYFIYNMVLSEFLLPIF